MSSPVQPNPEVQASSQTEPVHLKRRLGLLNATSINMSNMVGTGPFITLPLIIGSMGGPQALLGWLVGAVIAIADGMVWSELCAALPGSGGSYVYLRDSFGRNSWGRLWAFLFIFQLICSGPLEIASGNIAIAQYMHYLIPGMTNSQAKWLAVAAGGLATLLLYRKITSIARLMFSLWVGMLLTVGWVIVSGLFHFNRSIAFDFPSNAFAFDRGFILGLSSATLYVMYCYLGYYGVCYLGDEVKKPEWTIPRALIISIVGVLLINFLISLSIIGVIPWRQIVNSQFVASEMMQSIYGSWAGAGITILIVWTAFASIYALILTYSRVPFAAAQDGNFFRVFASVHPTKDFPHYSLLLIGGLSMIASFFDLADVITALMTARILVQFCGQIIGLEFLRRFHPEIPRPFKMWFYPLPSMLALIGWLAIFANSGLRFIAYGIATTLLGVLAYFALAAKSKLWPFSKMATAFIMLLPILTLTACVDARTSGRVQESQISMTAVPDGEIWFRNSQIQLRFDAEMYCRVFLKREGHLLSINDIPPDSAKAAPPHFIVTDGPEGTVKNFEVDYRNIGVSEIRTALGAGKRLHLAGYAKAHDQDVIEKEMTVELYTDYPDMAIVATTFRNSEDSKSLNVNYVVSSFFRFDARRTNASLESHALQLFCFNNKVAEVIGAKYARKIDFDDAGSVAPIQFIDIWTEEMGFAIAELSPMNAASVEVASDKKVEVKFEAKLNAQLSWGESWSGRSLWIVHTGDFRKALERYHQLTRRDPFPARQT